VNGGWRYRGEAFEVLDVVVEDEEDDDEADCAEGVRRERQNASNMRNETR
jgi:hypothetical protein